MANPARPRTARRLAARLLRTACGSVTVLLAAGLPSAHAQQPAEQPPVNGTPAAKPEVSLAECLEVGMSRQPAIAAARASLANAVIANDSLQATGRLAALFARDLPVRKEQGNRGVAASQAEVTQTEHDAAYSIVRCYYTVVYAQLQQQVAQDLVVNGIGFYRRQVKDWLNNPDIAKTVKDLDFANDLLDHYHGLAVTRLAEAEAGVLRAEAALREAMGVGPGCELTVRDRQLPNVAPDFDRRQVVELALCRRGEIAQVNLAAQIIHLEVEAQARLNNPFSRTFAISSDLHSRPLPAPIYNPPDYRPGALAPEMPPYLTGGKPTRINRAAALSDRANAVAAKAHGLVALEAEDAFARYQQAREQVKETAALARPADENLAVPPEELRNRLLKTSRTQFGTSTPKDALQQSLLVEVLVAQARAAANEALFLQVIALANLERVTAGGICAGFPTPAPPAPNGGAAP